MAEPSAQQPHEAQAQAQEAGFETAPNQADLRPTALESHLAREVLDWQERSLKPFRVMGEPLVM
jgi:hypothetical protein